MTPINVYNIKRWLLLACLLIRFSSYAACDEFSTAKDVDLYRIPMANEGYLSFRHTDQLGAGEEYTGWTDVRHPAQEGDTSSQRGYDYSDNQVLVLTHNVNTDAGDSRVGEGDRRRDFDVANASFAHPGITVRQEANIETQGFHIVRNADFFAEPEISELLGIDRSPHASTVNMYYVIDLPVGEGLALPPHYASRGGNAHGGTDIEPAPPEGFPTLNTGFVMTDFSLFQIPGEELEVRNLISPATFAHELAHMLMDNYRFSTELHPFSFHSETAETDLLHGRVLDPAWDLKHKIQEEEFGLIELGRMVGQLGTIGHFNDRVAEIGTDIQITQTEAIHRSPLVQHDPNGRTHADRADFDFVVDDIVIDQATTTGDNNATIDGDALVWHIGKIQESEHLHEGHDTNFDHDHGDWLTGDEVELKLDAFEGDFIRTVDVISQIARYQDMDVDAATGLWSERNSALDYGAVEFSEDGENWFEGDLVNVFVPGWNPRSMAEDYVARWSSPVDAQFVKISASTRNGIHDGNTQIDAIIASQSRVATVPEPAALQTVLCGLLLLPRYFFAQRRRR